MLAQRFAQNLDYSACPEMDSPKPTNRYRATLHDVAQAANVSPSTVSIVLAGKASKRRISEVTLKRVQEAAAQLGYTPNLLHRSLREGRTQVISFYNSFRNRDWTDLYIDRMSAGVEHAGGHFSYDVLVHCNFNRDLHQTYEFLNGGLSDGLILFGPSAMEPLLPLLRTSNLPTVLIDPRCDETVLSYVRDDEDAGMRMVAEALVENGHRRVAAITEVYEGVVDPMGRVARLQNELAKLGVELPKEHVTVWRGSPEAALRESLDKVPDATAVFVWHDRAAYRVVEACESMGIAVPDRLSVVGYDGLVWPSTTGHVVASVRVELDQVAEATVGLLHRLIQGEEGPLHDMVPVSFLPGTSLGPAPRVIS